VVIAVVCRDSLEKLYQENRRELSWNFTEVKWIETRYLSEKATFIAGD